MHAGWNLLLKQVPDRYPVTWWALLITALCFMPLLLAGPALPARVWPYVVASAVLEAAYFTILAAAYGRGDFSVVYPIARGTAPAFLALWAILFLQEYPNRIGLAGIAVLVLGLIAIGSSAWWRVRRQTTLRSTGMRLALCIALLISIYSV